MPRRAHLTPSLDEIEALDVAYARFNARRSLRVNDPVLTVARHGPVVALRDPSRPDDETYNRVLGVREDRLAALDAALAGYTTEPQVDVPIDACTPDLLRGLRARGLRPVRGVVWLAAAPDRLAPELPDGVSVRRFHPEDAGRFLDLLGAADPISNEVREKRERYYCTDTFPAFVATIADTPAGWATLWRAHERGIFGNAFTLPDHRGRGVQTALFAARAAHARSLGLSWVVTDVEPDTASYRNAVRGGFTRRTTMLWFRRDEG